MSYVVLIGALGERDAHVEAVLETAESYLGGWAIVARRERGRFRRPAREAEMVDVMVRVVEFTALESQMNCEKALALEEVLRAAMKLARGSRAARSASS